MRLLFDENMKDAIFDGLVQQNPTLDVVKARDVGLVQTPDSMILDWTAKENRIVVTHDIKTMPPEANLRLEAGLRMSEMFVISQDVPIGIAIEALLLVVNASSQDEWENRVVFLPLK